MYKVGLMLVVYPRGGRGVSLAFESLRLIAAPAADEAAAWPLALTWTPRALDCGF